VTTPVPRRTKPVQPRPITYRSYAAENDFGQCEAPGCTAPARASCTECGGELCRRHIEHADHS
jgi:hypothetical protein